MGAFHSTTTSTLNSRQLPVANGTVSFKTSKKRIFSQGIPKFSKKILTDDFFPFNFAPGISWYNFLKLAVRAILCASFQSHNLAQANNSGSLYCWGFGCGSSGRPKYRGIPKGRVDFSYCHKNSCWLFSSS